MIDLHLHTTASDGTLSPASLVARASAAGLRVISVTDHDTVAGLAEASAAAAPLGLRLVDGIEITAIEDGRDVHVLGYFFDPADRDLARLLDRQRADRIDRVREIGARLRGLNLAVDIEALLEAAGRQHGRSVGRPLVADALVAAGHAIDRRDAFDRLLGTGGPAFVPRCGPGVARVIEALGAAGGLASLAHPGLTGIDAHIPAFVQAGLAAIEVRHRDHDPATEARYRELARTLGVVVSGGSDFHGVIERAESGAPASSLGAVTLPEEDFTLLEARRAHAPARARAAADANPPR